MKQNVLKSFFKNLFAPAEKAAQKSVAALPPRGETPIVLRENEIKNWLLEHSKNSPEAAENAALGELQRLHKRLNAAARRILFFVENAAEEFPPLLNQAQFLKKWGAEPIRLAEADVADFEQMHRATLPPFIRRWATETGVHPLVSAFTFGDQKEAFLHPIYVAEAPFFIECVENGIESLFFEDLKSDSAQHFDARKNQFLRPDAQAIFEKHGSDSDRVFAKIFQVSHDIYFLMNGASAGRVVSPAIGDRGHEIGGQFFYQPYFSADVFEAHDFALETSCLSIVENYLLMYQNRLAEVGAA